MDNNNFESTSVKTVSPTSVLVFGILSVALSVPVVGLIFAIIARKKAKAFVEETGTTCGQVNVGRILATIGLVCNIISLCGAVLYAGYVVLLYVLMFLGMSASQYMLPLLFMH